jgi:hypothetical protein
LYDGIIDAQQTLGDIRAVWRRVEDQRRASRRRASRARGAAGRRGAAADGPDTFNSVIGSMNQLMGLLQGADVTPTTQLDGSGARDAVRRCEAQGKMGEVTKAIGTRRSAQSPQRKMSFCVLCDLCVQRALLYASVRSSSPSLATMSCPDVAGLTALSMNAILPAGSM